MRATVVAGGKESEPFDITNGMKQGCVLAPALFSLFLTAVLRTAALEAARESVWSVEAQGSYLI